MSDERPICTRFAPSPSGDLHVGGARTALFCWAFAKGRGGKFILRIEDTDQKRSSDAASLGFLKDLKWLGIDWDEGPEFEGCGGGKAGPYFQSERLETYQTLIDQLIEEGKAYRAFDTPEQLDAARKAARESKQNYRYDRAGLALDAATVEKYLAEGRPSVVRLRIPDDRDVVIRDEVLGEVTRRADELDDFVIQKADGFPTYHFAVVVDDELMGVTHVIRGQEHLNNTARHMLLQEAMGYRTPVYAHVSTITNPDKSKMSKRDKDKALRAEVKSRKLSAPPPDTVDAERWAWWLSKKDHQLGVDEGERLADAMGVELPEINVEDFRRAGYLPEVLVNYLALLGWNPGGDVEKFDRAFLIERFGLDRIVKSSASFDRNKLLAFNLDAIQEMSPDEFAQRYRSHCEQYHPGFAAALTTEQFDLLARANQSRAKTLDDTVASSRFFIMDDDAITYEQSKPVRKALCNGEPSGYAHLEQIAAVLEALDDWSPDGLEQAVKQYATDHADGKLGKVAQPLRIAVSGGTISPAIFDTLAILGRDSVLRRIERCLATRETICAA